MAQTDLGLGFSLGDLAKAFDKSSDDIKREVVELINRSALEMKTRVQASYPIGPTGNLHHDVFVTQPRYFSITAGGVPIPSKKVRATSKHVHIWQEGTAERFDSTRANARRGRSPAHGRVFERTAAQVRREMIADAQRVVDRQRSLG